jgi:hypothetical protein
MNKRNLIKTLCLVFCLLTVGGCNRFHKTRLLQSVGYYADECCVRDRTHHKARYPNKTSPGRTNIQAREYRCRIERICIGKSEAENQKCKEDAGNYWGFTEDNQVYKILKHNDDESDVKCAINPSSCFPGFKPQENYSTNPYWNKKTKSYILPEKLKNDQHL